MSDEDVTATADKEDVSDDQVKDEDQTKEDVDDADKQDDDQTDTDEKNDEDGDDADKSKPADFEDLTLPKEADAYKEDLGKFQDDLRDWMKANPDHSTGDLLQHIVDRQAEIAKAAETSQSDEWTKQVDTWKAETKNHKEFGGEAFEENAAIARTVVKNFGDKDVREILESSGLGEHPAVFAMHLKIGKLLQEAGIDPDGGAVDAEGDELYRHRYKD